MKYAVFYEKHFKTKNYVQAEKHLFWGSSTSKIYSWTDRNDQNLLRRAEFTITNIKALISPLGVVENPASLNDYYLYAYA